MAAMSAALRSSAEPEERPAAANAARPARIAVIDSFEAAESAWRALDADAIATPYQRYDWLAAWQRHVGAALGVRPFLILGTDEAGVPLFLWPLGRVRKGPLTVAGFLGGKHANFNLALWHRDVIGEIGEAQLAGILAQIAAAGTPVDLITLRNQPQAWGGFVNPLAALPRQASPSPGYRGALAADFEALMRMRTSSSTRRKMRSKESKLTAFGPVSYRRAENVAEAERILEAFLVQKRERMREMGVIDAFGAPGVHAFLAEAAKAGLAAGKPVIELYALYVGDRIAATFGGAVRDGRFCGMFNSFVRCELAQHSPGELLLAHVVRTCCERGLTMFDLGVGEAPYKRVFCAEQEPLFDCFVPLTAVGAAAAAAARAAFAAKGWMKRSPALWRATQAVRRRIGKARVAG